MLINGKNVDIDELCNLNGIEDNMHNIKYNGFMLSNSQIEVLNRYNIDYQKYASISGLICEIEDILNNEEDFEDLEKLSLELAEFNYYQNTNK